MESFWTSGGHQDRVRVATIHQADGVWVLVWDPDYVSATFHETALAAVAAARDSYAAYLAAEYASDEEGRRNEATAKRQGGAVARAVRAPMGGQRKLPNSAK
ncbi:hypothetical protein [Streptomyces sp. SPB074]|uniref:hypothetical protein n=1 Tax=Streptomyces sp. (strain SPB074) TaxID=465543 RepID=UPI00017FE909|nr:hypothetical protein [Streptomyces sp. SPB074]EDY43186.1 hypothetical protein SSBG_01148 [Streptomyces sp. SPB074]